MKDWNVVASVREGHFLEAQDVLGEYGPVAKTDFYNVLVMRVADVDKMLDALQRRIEGNPESLSCITRLLPVTNAFSFQSPEEFEDKAKDTVLAWLPRLGGKRFYVRMHRRGFKGKLSSVEEERFLDDTVLAALENAGTPGQVGFEDADAVIAIETVGPRAGLSFWEREDIAKYPFLRLG